MRIRQNLFSLQINSEQKISVNQILNLKKYKTTFASNISWMRSRRDDVRRANGIKNYKENKRQTKVPLWEK